MERTVQPVPPALLAISFVAVLGLLSGAFWACAIQDDHRIALAGDQTYIDLLYAQNIAGGIGPRYLPDHPKTLAPASSLRVALLSMVGWLFDGQWEMLWAAVILGLGSLWLGLVIGALWLRRSEGGGSEIAFLLVTLSHGGILWLLWSGDTGALVVPLCALCTLSVYCRSLSTARLWVAGLSGFLLGLCSWPGYAYAVGTSLFLWSVAIRNNSARAPTGACPIGINSRTDRKVRPYEGSSQFSPQRSGGVRGGLISLELDNPLLRLPQTLGEELTTTAACPYDQGRGGALSPPGDQSAGKIPSPPDDPSAGGTTSLRDPFQLAFWAAALPVMGGGGLILLNWAWSGLWEGGGPVAEMNLVGCISLQAILRLDWTRGVLDVLHRFGSLGTPIAVLPWIVFPVTLFGLLAEAGRDSSDRTPTELLPLVQFLALIAFLGFLPEDRRETEVLPFLPVFLLFSIRGIRQLARLIDPVRDVVSWIVIVGAVVMHAWWVPDWYRRADELCTKQLQSSILPAEEIQNVLSKEGRIAAGDDPALFWHIGPHFLGNGFFGSGYRLRIDLAGKEYAGVRRDALRLLLEVPDVVAFPARADLSKRSAFPDIETAKKEFTSVGYEVQTREHTILLCIPDYVPLWEARERAIQRLIRAGREHDVLWSVAAGDLKPKPILQQRSRWRERIENSLGRLVGERWDFERGLPQSCEVVGEGIQVGWSSPVPVEGVRALSTGGPEHPEHIGTVRSTEFRIAGDLMQLAVAGVGAATECFVSLLVWESTENRPLQPDPVTEAEHFYHWSGQPLRGNVFFYLVPSKLSPVESARQGWRVVRSAHPRSPDSWEYIRWPVRSWRGMRARWEICDRSSEGWIVVDGIRQRLRPPGRYWDFEEGTYEGWTIEGEAFGDHPVVGPFPGQQPVSGRQGDFCVNTFVNGSDSAQGILRSATFPIDHQFLRFCIGGGDSHLRTALHLYVDGQLALSASGQRDERLRPVVWHLREAYGHEGQLEIVDLESGPWGHLLVDDIALIDEGAL